MNLDRVKQIADAVLYEGYILYPYRASTVKNQHRFNFGVLAPTMGTEVVCGQHPQGRSGKLPPSPFAIRTECLVEGGKPAMGVCVRFLHMVSREIYTTDNMLVPSLEVDDRVYHTWQEAVEREVIVQHVHFDVLAAAPQQTEFAFESRETSETLNDADGKVRGKLVWRQPAIQGVVAMDAAPRGEGQWRVRVEVANTTPVPADYANWTRDEAMLRSLVSTHTILACRDGHFVSLFDPPAELAQAAGECENIGTWPVLVGDEGDRDMMLSSPIILYDYPQVAPESGGDFFDGTEIDEMLALRVMTLTAEEKREMQQVDDRARQILERTESLPAEHWQKLHGAIRNLRTIS